MYNYYRGNQVAGYSGFVIYGFLCNTPSTGWWMIPGTWEYDWDNQVKGN